MMAGIQMSETEATGARGERLQAAPGQPASLEDQLRQIRQEMMELESKADPVLQHVPPDRQPSARNLLHYVALRRNDIRELQEQLVLRGLSSLGRCEAYVMANVEAVLGILSGTTAAGVQTSASTVPVDFVRGRELLMQRTERLFGGRRSDPPIMVTMASEAAEDYAQVRNLLRAGMSVMRINCAHDDSIAWAAMIENLRRAERELGRSCRIAMDLGGPKIRTGPIEPGPRVLHWRPHRDEFGAVTAPARIWISPTAPAGRPPGCDATVRVSEEWWRTIQVGDTLELKDAAGRHRQLTVARASAQGLLVEATQGAYVTPETILTRVRSHAAAQPPPQMLGRQVLGRLGQVEPRGNSILLRKGDQLVITEATTLGQGAQQDELGHLTAAARIGCTLADIFRNVRAGQRILLDDGKIAGLVQEASEQGLVVLITRARDKGERLRADKGMNFPDTELQLPALTDRDIEDLNFIAAHADIVSYSFVRRPEDIRLLHRELARLGRPDMGIILKIENRQAFENLPLLLLEVMCCSPATGVMIARGDLAVECGWERLVEVQEEILWMCEAAHMPVVWATQVLEGMAKNGMPSRAEVTDAGMGARAECVMLNKGPNIVETVQILHDILRRMQQHQVKKRPTFRRLVMADSLFATSPTD